MKIEENKLCLFKNKLRKPISDSSLFIFYVRRVFAVLLMIS